MKRILAGMLVCALGTTPLAAQERRIQFKVSFDADKTRASIQGAPPAPAARTGRASSEKAIYAISLGAAVAGTAYLVRNTREALDDGLEVRTFPVVWVKTSDPKDKGKLTAIIAGTNGAIMAISAIAFKNHNAKVATLLNVFIAGFTTGVALHERSVINKHKS